MSNPAGRIWGDRFSDLKIISEVIFEVISEIIEGIQTNLPFPHQTIKNHNLSKSIGVDHLTTDNASFSVGFQQFSTSVQPIMLTNTPNGITILGLLIGGMNFCVAAPPPRKNSYLD
jgi:hypothetical protein